MSGAEKTGEGGIQQKTVGLAELHEPGTEETGKTNPFFSPRMSRKQNSVSVNEAGEAKKAPEYGNLSCRQAFLCAHLPTRLLCKARLPAWTRQRNRCPLCAAGPVGEAPCTGWKDAEVPSGLISNEC